MNDPKGPEKSVDSSLAVTGSETQSALLIGALVALLLGAGIITANRIAKRRAHQ
ncbi:MAG: LPXTG cell wall anchor domain-containing protein [Aurantimicrobium sp.]